MRAVVQRVTHACVRVDQNVVGRIEKGFVVLLGVTHEDAATSAAWLARKVAGLRIFSDETGRMNHDLREAGGGALVVPQFTLYGDVRRGLRPDFTRASPPETAEPLFEKFCSALTGEGVRVERGVFRAHMEVELVNDGPVTILLETPDTVSESP
jgi:D-tyrosyl-tRNA(Tyr) deacylase